MTKIIMTAMDLFLNNVYMKKYLIYCKNNFPYYSYLINKTVFYSATNLIIISNKKKNNFEYLDIFGKPDIVK